MYAIVVDGKVQMCSLMTLQKQYPHVSFPADFLTEESNRANLNIYEVYYDEVPSVNCLFETVIEQPAKFDGRKVTVSYKVQRKQPMEIAESLELEKQRLDGVCTELLQEFATMHGYTSIETMISYHVSSIKAWAEHARNASIIRDFLWTKCFEIKNSLSVSDIENGNYEEKLREAYSAVLENLKHDTKGA